MSKGSRPRPFSVSQAQFDNNYEMIFGKKKIMSEQEQQEKVGARCGCGRSPLGYCIGWHALTEDEFRQKLAEHEANVIPKNNIVE